MQGKKLADAEVYEEEHNNLLRNLLAEVDNKCIEMLYCSFQDEQNLYLIMEYLPGGDMTHMTALLMLKDILTDDVTKYEGQTSGADVAARFSVAEPQVEKVEGTAAATVAAAEK
ncbi:serine/threonine kinase 38 [Vigna unguiculata]|uniref:Serine/threonine kinase 38 n=1 Tax=Vigna unguiculata TaxID=3917 RepID=A0A4D6M682_VIGUN|nr:serine/threonine kinase 38 [Vigna unguiculata]